MRTNRKGPVALTAALITCSAGYLNAGTLQFGVVGSAIDLSANVSEAIVPGSTIFQESQPLFGTAPDPKHSAELLHISSVGVNASGRSTNISGAFASSLAESDGNGGVGVSQLIFGSPGGQDVVRQLLAQSLWTQTLLYNGTSVVNLSIHLDIPSMQVGLLGVPPRRTGISAAETAEADALLVEEVSHPDGSIEGRRFEIGLREFERQIPSGPDLLNVADVQILGIDASLGHLTFNFDDFNPSFSFSPLSVDVDLGALHPGDILSYVYTLTARGTTHGFERGYFAFLGDPFGLESLTNNLSVTVTPADAPSSAPEAGSSALMLFGFAGLFGWQVYARRIPPRAQR